MTSTQRSSSLAARAAAIIPGGHHSSGRALLADQPPLYFERARGCRIWDVDGTEYIDYLMAYGAILLGYADEEVDAAAMAQLRKGSLVSLNHRLHVEFMERLLARVPGAERGMFFKTGSEATTAALRIARRATGRRDIARCGYHGWHDWCYPDDPGVPAELGVHEFAAADPRSLERIGAEHALAAVIVAPEMVLPASAEPFHALIRIAHRAGAVVILDEVKTGFRIQPGTFQQAFGLAPDLTTLSKALGNGWPIAAVVGIASVMEHAAAAPLSATYHGDTAAMAAALATLAISDRDGVPAQLWHTGQRLIDGLGNAARRHRVAAEAYGEPLPPMPFLRFTDPDPDRNARVRDAFFAHVHAHGLLLHPRHLWFVSRAHGERELSRTLEICDEAFAIAAGVA